MFCALFLFCFNYDVGVLRTICFLLSLLRWCFMLNLGSTLTNTWVFCAQFVFYFHYHVGVLRSICFLLSLLRLCFALCFLLSLIRGFFAHFLFSTFTTICFLIFLNYYVGMLRTIYYLVSLTIRLVCCALFVFYFDCNVGFFCSICFLL